MDTLNVKYVFTITGGGWTRQHDLYVITNDNSVLYTSNFDDSNLEAAQPGFVLRLDEKLNFKRHTIKVGFDAPVCTMYSVKRGKLKKLYEVGMYNNTPAVDTVLSAVHKKLWD